MPDAWPWAAVAGLGAFHGLNPAMGWLFAVALGLHRGETRTVLVSLVPIAFGHAFAVGAQILGFVLLGQWIDGALVQKIAAGLLIGWAAYLWRYGHHGRVRFGFRTGLLGLFAWSFLMASAHGAGIMLWPAIAPLCSPGATNSAAAFAGPLPTALAAVALHTAAMLAVTGAVAVAVYRWIGVGILKSAWINFDALWIGALLALGILLLAV